MQKVKKWIKGHKKVPKCVVVYNKLYKMIKKGTFDGEGKLPTEPVLAQLMGVSRATLRQSIALLREDRLIKNIQGKGNYIIKDTKIVKKGLEFMQNPIYSLVEEDIDNVEVDYRIVETSDYAKNILLTPEDEVIFFDRWYKNGEKTLAYTLSLAAIDTVEKLDVDLLDKKSLLYFLENTVYCKPNISKIKISVSSLGNLVSDKYPISEGDQFYLVEEKIALLSGKIVLHNKHYVSEDLANIIISRSRL